MPAQKGNDLKKMQKVKDLTLLRSPKEKNKEQLRVFISASPQYDEKDNIKGLVGMGVDITNLTRTRTEMERTATELTQLIDTANAPIFGVDTEGNINEWNQMVTRITGYGNLDGIHWSKECISSS